MRTIDTQRFDQLQEETRQLIERSRYLAERSAQVQVSSVVLADHLAQLEQRTQAVLDEAQRATWNKYITQ